MLMLIGLFYHWLAIPEVAVGSSSGGGDFEFSVWPVSFFDESSDFFVKIP